MNSQHVQSSVTATAGAMGLLSPWWLPIFNEWGQAVLVIGGVVVLALQAWGYVFGFPWGKNKDE
jgi:hypothetical protein